MKVDVSCILLTVTISESKLFKLKSEVSKLKLDILLLTPFIV